VASNSGSLREVLAAFIRKKWTVLGRFWTGFDPAIPALSFDILGGFFLPRKNGACFAGAGFGPALRFSRPSGPPHQAYEADPLCRHRENPAHGEGRVCSSNSCTGKSGDAMTKRVRAKKFYKIVPYGPDRIFWGRRKEEPRQKACEYGPGPAGQAPACRGQQAVRIRRGKAGARQRQKLKGYLRNIFRAQGSTASMSKAGRMEGRCDLPVECWEKT